MLRLDAEQTRPLLDRLPGSTIPSSDGVDSGPRPDQGRSAATPLPSASTEHNNASARTLDGPEDVPQFSAIIDRTRSGVFRVETVRCLGGRQGTGFLISPRLVATAAHVVADASAVTVHIGTHDVEGTVIGYDEDTDLALVHLADRRDEDAIVGHVFTATDGPPKIGDEVLALGYPRTHGLTASTGGVIALHDDAVIGAPTRQDYLETTIELVPGNSGGPILDRSGLVVGLAVSVLANDKSKSFAVMSEEAWTAFERWIERPSPPQASACEPSVAE